MSVRFENDADLNMARRVHARSLAPAEVAKSLGPPQQLISIIRRQVKTVKDAASGTDGKLGEPRQQIDQARLKFVQCRCLALDLRQEPLQAQPLVELGVLHRLQDHEPALGSDGEAGHPQLGYETAVAVLDPRK